MDIYKTVIERAFEIARSGDCRTMAQLRKQLKGEGYNLHQVVGRTLVRQLTDLMVQAREGHPRDEDLHFRAAGKTARREDNAE